MTMGDLVRHPFKILFIKAQKPHIADQVFLGGIYDEYVGILQIEWLIRCIQQVQHALPM